MPTVKISYGTWTTLTVTSLASLANDATSPFGAWQSARIDNQTSELADDYEIIGKIPMANTAPANDKSLYCYVVPWVYDSSAWNLGGNFGTTTAPTGSEGTASIVDPNSMKGPISIPYPTQDMDCNFFFNICQLCGVCPDGWSLAIRNCSGAAVDSSGIIIAYRSVKYTVG